MVKMKRKIMAAVFAARSPKGVGDRDRINTVSRKGEHSGNLLEKLADGSRLLEPKRAHRPYVATSGVWSLPGEADLSGILFSETTPSLGGALWSGRSVSAVLVVWLLQDGCEVVQSGSCLSAAEMSVLVVAEESLASGTSASSVRPSKCLRLSSSCF